MPLISIKNDLIRAQQEKYAIPLFDTSDMQSTDAMFAIVEEKRAPIIIAVYDGLMKKDNARAFTTYIRTRAEEATVPVALMLDHGGSFEMCMRAIAYGFTDVMYDGSKLPLEENIRNTQAVVRAAHAVGVAVEAELGHVGFGNDYEDHALRREGFTDPDTAVQFVKETGVDFLAIAIGTAHGLYKGDPELDFDLLREIRSKVDVPLVLHGGSGCTDEQFRTAVAGGITKVNIATDLYVTTAKRLSEATQAENANYFGLMGTAIESFKERCGFYLDLFGASGKA